MIAGKKWWGLVLDCGVVYIESVKILKWFWCKKCNFDRVVLFVDLVWLNSIDFTGGLWDWWVVNWLVLMCYFFIKYMVFGWVRLKPYFIRAERCFWWDSGDFWWCENGWKHWFLGILSKWVSNSKWGSRCGNNRYALSGNRIFVLKCKLRPLLA